MREVFQNYKHYVDWLNTNWENSRDLDKEIISRNLVLAKTVNCNGEMYRSLTKAEFSEMEKEGFIQIPRV